MLLQTLSPRLAPLAEYLESLTAPAELATLTRLLGEVRITRADLGPSVHFTPEKYARNRVALTDWFELVTLCWLPSQSSCIHDHTGAACAFRVIEGEGIEQSFARNPDGTVRPISQRPMPEGFICGAKDADIHQVVNQSGRDLITLHIYTPPLAKWNMYELAQG